MKSYLVKINMTAPDRDRIINTLRINRDVWNKCSKSLFEKPTTSLKELHDRVYKKLRKKFPQLPSQIVIKAEQDCLSAYRSIRSNKRTVKAATIKKRLSYQLDARIFTLKNDILSLTAIGGKRIKCQLVLYSKVKEAMQQGIHDPKLFERIGELWLSVPCKTPSPPVIENFSIGVDLGIKRSVVTSEGLFISRKGFNKRLRCFSFNKRKLQTKKTRSAKRKLKTFSNKHRNMSKDFTHCCVNKVLDTKANIIAVEWLKSLKLKNRGKYMNRRLSQWAHGEFKRILEYKAQILGKRIVTVKPAFTSQNDWRNIPKGKRQGCRYYASDSVVLDADWNAAMNIAKLSNISVSHCKMLDGQALVIEPNVSHNINNVKLHVLQAPEFIPG